MDNFIALLTSGIVGGFVGTFFGGFSKFFWERWLPERLTWRREQHVRQRQLLATHRDPSVRAINELQGRLWVILSTRAANYHYVKKQGNALVDLLDFVDPEHRWVKADRRNKFSETPVPDSGAQRTPTHKRR